MHKQMAKKMEIQIFYHITFKQQQNIENLSNYASKHKTMTLKSN